MTLVARRLSSVGPVALLLTSACVVGPNFKPPPPPPVSNYTSRPPAQTESAPGVSAGQQQTFRSGADIPADWWTLFHSKPLNDLIEQALANNADLKAAQAALLVAHENTLGPSAVPRLPQVSAGAQHHSPEGSFGRARAGAEQQCVSLHAGDTAAQRLLRARRVRAATSGRSRPPRRRSRRAAIR